MASPVKMTLVRPAGRLASYVRCFQVLSTAPSVRASVLDFGGGDVSVPLCFGDPLRVEDWNHAEVPSAAVVGPRRSAVWLEFNGGVDQVNVSFFPGAAGCFVGLSMPELVDAMARPDDVWPRQFQQAVAELAPLSAEQRVARLAQLLLSRLEPRRELPPQIREAVRLIRQMRGQVRVEWLAHEVNLSISQLERDFKDRIGLTPKLVARQTRIAAVAGDAMRDRPPAWARLSANHGYADQAHLARDFRDLTGLTPSEFLGAGEDAEFLQDALARPRRS
jgi:methylphosphotriester-DNA--protein-cysteine methyltransferase